MWKPVADFHIFPQSQTNLIKNVDTKIVLKINDLK